MSPLRTSVARSLFLAAFAALLLQGALQNCTACGISPESTECHTCHDHGEKSHDAPTAPGHSCEIHASIEVVHAHRMEVNVPALELPPSACVLQQLENTTAAETFVMASPPDPFYIRCLHTTLIRC
jgi:hypothetical protein